MTRGRLRIYLGAAPGVGKTFAMLNEGRRRRERGADVVVAYVETHGRANTAAQLGDLEVIRRRPITYRGSVVEELDLEAVLARRPQVALVDELAHTNIPGAGNEKRWQDVHAMLDAGIDVISTVNVQHLESLNDVVESITGIRQRETVPDHVVRDADQVELIDMTPEALRRRMAHGNVYAAEKVDAALANYFRPGNLAALRELALLWVADKVDDALAGYRDDHHITSTWETRERVLVAVTGAPGAGHLIRRAARIAGRRHGELIGVHVRVSEGVAQQARSLEAERRLVEDLGGTFHEVVAPDIVDGLVRFARAEQATQIVLGATGRRRWQELIAGSVVNRVIRRCGDIDVHVIAGGDDPTPGRHLPVPRRRNTPLPPRRQAIGWSIGLLSLPLLTAALVALRPHIDLSTVLLLYLLDVVVVAAIGGLRPAIAGAIGATLAANWYFTVPYRTLRMTDADQLVALAVFVALTSLVSVLVGESARQSAAAERARAEATALAGAAGQMSGGEDALGGLLGHVRLIFDQRAVAVTSRRTDDRWEVESIDRDPSAPVVLGPPGITIDLAEDCRLELWPGDITGDDRRVLDAFTIRLADALARRRLEQLNRSLASRRHEDEFRTAILRAVSHDLRSPLASIKASASSLVQDDVVWTDAERREFAVTIDEEADRLDRLIGNLLDMSRIEAGGIDPVRRAANLADVVDAAVASLGPIGRGVTTAMPDDIIVRTDTALLERIVANLAANALAHSPPDVPPVIDAGRFGDEVVVRVIDRGPGLDPEARASAFSPFQRLGDQRPGGVGLGLAVVAGFVRALGGTVTLDDTPGGGLTATVRLREVTSTAPDENGPREQGGT